ncbi:MAG: hypothetical protein AAB534_02750 [Patescibacteria group bacterium]
MDKLIEQLKKNKIALIILIVLIVVFWLYKSSGTEVEPLITALQGSPSSQILGAELLVELQRLKSLNQLDVNFFDNRTFDSLKDISVVVSPQPIGRDNPFIQ